MGETITSENTAAHRAAAGTHVRINALTLPGGIGYIALPQFLPVEIIADQMNAAFQALGDTRGLILDLRANTGGPVATASLLASLLFDTEPAYRVEVYRPWSTGDQQDTAVCTVRYHAPVLVLVGRRTAAVAWRFARNLADMGRVLIAGELPAVAHGTSGAAIGLPVAEGLALRRAQERLASG